MPYPFDLKVVGAQGLDDLLVGLNLLSDRGSEAVEHPLERELLHRAGTAIIASSICQLVNRRRTTTRYLIRGSATSAIPGRRYSSPRPRGPQCRALFTKRPDFPGPGGIFRAWARALSLRVFVVDSNAVLFNRARSITGNRLVQARVDSTTHCLDTSRPHKSNQVRTWRFRIIAGSADADVSLARHFLSEESADKAR